MVFRTQPILDFKKSLRGLAASLVVAAIVGIPTASLGQSDSGFESNPARQKEESVLVQEDEGQEKFSPAQANANGAMKIGDEPQSKGTSTFTAQPLPEPPKIPATFKSDPLKKMLVPQDPTEETFTKPFVNELRGESLDTGKPHSDKSEAAAASKAPGDGTEALGTFATTNPARQDQPLGPGAPPARPWSAGPEKTFTPPVNPGAFSNQGFSPSTGAPSASAQPATGSSRVGGQGMPPIVTDQPSQWKPDPPSSSQRNNFGTGVAGQHSGAGNPIVTPKAFTPPASSRTPISGRSESALYNESLPNPTSSDGVRKSVVQPTGFNQPVSSSVAKLGMAKSLIAQYSASIVGGELPGRAVKLVDLLRQPVPLETRKALIIQYWSTYYDFAKWVNEQQHAQLVSRIPTPANTYEKAMLDVAKATATNRVLAAKIQLGKSQSKLVQFLPNWNSDQLPIPNDIPLIQKYKTNYDLYKSHQLMPANLRGIDQMLPDTLEVIVNRAQSVQLATNATNLIQQALTTRQARTLDAIDTVRQSRFLNQDFVASVVRYNQAIADYALTVARGYQTPEQVEAMLIGKPQGRQNVARRLNDTGAARWPNSGRISNLPTPPASSRLPGTSSPTSMGNPGSRPGSTAAPNNGFNLKTQNGIPSNVQPRTPNTGQSVLGNPVAPATPVNQNFGGASGSGGSFGGQSPPSVQPFGGGRSAPSPGAQSPFGPPIGTGR